MVGTFVVDRIHHLHLGARPQAEKTLGHHPVAIRQTFENLHLFIKLQATAHLDALRLGGIVQAIHKGAAGIVLQGIERNSASRHFRRGQGDATQLARASPLGHRLQPHLHRPLPGRGIHDRMHPQQLAGEIPVTQAIDTHIHRIAHRHLTEQALRHPHRGGNQIGIKQCENVFVERHHIARLLQASADNAVERGFDHRARKLGALQRLGGTRQFQRRARPGQLILGGQPFRHQALQSFKIQLRLLARGHRHLQLSTDQRVIQTHQLRPRCDTIPFGIWQAQNTPGTFAVNMHRTRRLQRTGERALDAHGLLGNGDNLHRVVGAFLVFFVRLLGIGTLAAGAEPEGAADNNGNGREVFSGQFWRHLNGTPNNR